MGRFTQEDPLGFVDGPNAYGYVGGNPMQFADPMGLWRWGDPLPQGLVDFSAGAGDMLSFGATSGIRGWMGIGGVNKCSGAYMGGQAAGFVVGLAIGGAGGARGLSGYMKGLTNKTKGNVGEWLSFFENRLKLSRLLREKAKIPGFSTRFDSIWKSVWGDIYYVESKFGTSGLTPAQRVAAAALGDLYHVERWSYPFFERVGAYTGVATVAAGMGIADGPTNCGCQ